MEFGRRILGRKIEIMVCLLQSWIFCRYTDNVAKHFHFYKNCVIQFNSKEGGKNERKKKGRKKKGRKKDRERKKQERKMKERKNK